MSITRYDKSHAVPACTLMVADVFAVWRNGGFVDYVVVDVVADDESVIVDVIVGDVPKTVTLDADGTVLIVGDVVPRDRQGEVPGVNNDGCEPTRRVFRHVESFYVPHPKIANAMIAEGVLERHEARARMGIDHYDFAHVPGDVEWFAEQQRMMRRRLAAAVWRVRWMRWEVSTPEHLRPEQPKATLESETRAWQERAERAARRVEALRALDSVG